MHTSDARKAGEEERRIHLLGSRICWSESEALPIVILAPAGNTTFKIKAIDHRAFDDGIFRPDIRGYVRNDAVHDISGD